MLIEFSFVVLFLSCFALKHTRSGIIMNIRSNSINETSTTMHSFKFILMHSTYMKNKAYGLYTQTCIDQYLLKEMCNKLENKVLLALFNCFNTIHSQFNSDLPAVCIFFFRY